MPALETLRDELADIDDAIMQLIGRRNRAAAEIGKIKAEQAAPVVVSAVERRVEARYAKAAKQYGVSASCAWTVARAVIDESVEVQGKLPRRQTPQRICIVGGNGGMGRWLTRFFLSRGHTVCMYDVAKSSEGGVFVPLEEGCRTADTVVIAVPVTAADAVLEQVLSLSRPATLIFDILSVKAPVADRLKAAAAAGRRVCSVHPMFGPHAPSVAGRNVIAADCGCPAATAEAAALFDGADILTMPIDNHDAAAAYVLGLSHAVNLAFSDALTMSGFSSAELRAAGSTTFRKQTAVSCEVAGENAALYYSIQRENPKNDAALENLERAVHRVRTMNRDEFIAAMKKEAAWYQSSG